MATALSQGEGLLVVREQGSNLPNLANQGVFAPENVIVVAQMQGEPGAAFVSRVLGRTQRELAGKRPLRAAVVSVGANAPKDWAESRRKIVVGLGELLAVRPDSEMQIMSPGSLGVQEQMQLFELIESVLRKAPRLNVRLAFADTLSGNDRNGKGRTRKTSRGVIQSVAA